MLFLQQWHSCWAFLHQGMPTAVAVTVLAVTAAEVTVVVEVGKEVAEVGKEEVEVGKEEVAVGTEAEALVLTFRLDRCGVRSGTSIRIPTTLHRLPSRVSRINTQYHSPRFRFSTIGITARHLMATIHTCSNALTVG